MARFDELHRLQRKVHTYQRQPDTKDTFSRTHHTKQSFSKTSPTPDNVLTLRSNTHEIQIKPQALTDQFGIKSPVQLMHFLNTPEGKRIKFKIQKRLEIRKIRKELAEMKRGTESAKLRRELIAALVERMNNKAHKQHLREAAAQALRHVLLEDDPELNNNPKTFTEKLRGAYTNALGYEQSLLQEENEALEYENSLIQREFDDLSELEQKIINLRNSAEQTPEPKPTPENRPQPEPSNEDDFQAQLTALKEQFQKDLAGLEHSLTQSDVAPTDKPSPTLKLNPKTPAQTKQVQTLRSQFRESMKSKLNQLSEHGLEPTPGNIAQRHEQLNPETDLNGMRSQIVNHYRALENDIASRRNTLTSQQATTTAQHKANQTTINSMQNTLNHQTITQQYDMRTQPQHGAKPTAPTPTHKPSSPSPYR